MQTIRTRFENKPWYRWYAVGVLTAVYASSQVDRQIMAILLEPIKIELGASDTQMGFLVGLTFAIFYATLGMPIAMLADRTNRRNIITAAISIWSAMTVLCGYAASFFQLALARIGVGVGEAGSTPPSHSIIADLFPPERRGTAMGVFALGVNIGLLIAYLAGGWLSEHYGWRLTFVIVGLPGLLIAAILYLTVAEPNARRRRRAGGRAGDARAGFGTRIRHGCPAHVARPLDPAPVPRIRAGRFHRLRLRALDAFVPGPLPRTLADRGGSDPGVDDGRGRFAGDLHRRQADGRSVRT